MTSSAARPPPHARCAISSTEPTTGETIDVCVCTFRRQSLEATLSSIAAQALPPGVSIRAIVADNDTRPIGREAIETHAALLDLPLTYLHAPERNISVARNACLDAATADWMAFIDDDEVARPDWIAMLLSARAKADIVFGTSHAVYAPDAPRWLVAGDFHSNRLSGNDAEWNGYTSNVLIDRRFVARHAIRFDLALGQTGGEDTMFFHAAHSAGARFGYAPEAVVDEAVPRQRATLGWLAKRRFRAGQIHFLVLAREGQPRSGALAAAAKAGWCVVAALATIVRPARAASHALRGALHAGVLASAIGFAPYREYGGRRG